MSEWKTFESRDALAQSLADEILARLEAAIAQRGSARLVVSGGSTPLKLYAELSARDFDWARVEIALADERLVPADHPRSNAGMLRAELLRNKAAAARYLDMEAIEASWSGSPRFDLVMLGMGGDGHTASLFPDAPELASALADDSPLLQRMHPPSQPEPRLTLSANALCDCSALILHIEGEDKRAVLEQAAGDGPVEALPIRAFLRQQRTPLAIYWAP